MYLIAKLLLNSLYGKFGMSEDLSTHKIININKLENFMNTKERITLTELDEELVLISYHDINEDKLINDDTELNISIGVASAITAYSRIQMSKYKNIPKNRLFYTDTDSAVMEFPLPEYLVGNKLGKFVLEKEYAEFIGLAPKVYGGILTDGTEFTKIKGFKNKVSFTDLKSLLIENKSLSLEQEKWFRYIGKGTISIKNQIYTLVATSNKRTLIYKKGKLIGTKAKVL